MQLSEFRTKYPQYDEVSDTDLAQKLHGKYYSNMEYDVFAEKFGVGTTDPAQEKQPKQEELGVIPAEPAYQYDKAEDISGSAMPEQQKRSAAEYGLAPEQEAQEVAGVTIEPEQFPTISPMSEEGLLERAQTREDPLWRQKGMIEEYPGEYTGRQPGKTMEPLGERNKVAQIIDSIIGAPGEKTDEEAAKATIEWQARQEGMSSSEFRERYGARTGLLERGIKDVGSGAITTASGLIGYAARLAPDDIGAGLRAAQGNINQAAKDLMTYDPNLVDEILAGFGSTTTFFVPGLGIAKGVQAISNVAPRMALWLGSGASAGMEASVEAGMVYDEMLEKTGSKAEAVKSADQVFWGNVPLLVITNKLGLFADRGNQIQRRTMAAVMEGPLQEGPQQIISNVAAGNPAMDGFGKSVLIGSIVGFTLGGTQQPDKAELDRIEQIKADKEFSSMWKELEDLAAETKRIRSEEKSANKQKAYEQLVREKAAQIADAWEAREGGLDVAKKADEDKAYAEMQKTTVVPADLEPAAPTVAGQIEQSLEAEKAERAVSDKPKSAMEAAFEAAKPKKKYGLPIEEAATQVDTAPTEAQKEAGNYKKGHTQVQGMDVAIENPKGSVREGVDEGGQKWSQKMDAHYGYIKRTQGADGDHVDVFLGPDAETANTFYVVNQTNPTTGKFDEHKVMIGYPDANTAKVAYMKNYAKGWGGFDSIVPLNTEQFKRFVHSKAKTSKALPDSATILMSTSKEKVMPVQKKMPTPNLMDMERDPQYQAEKKGRQLTKETMTPDEYMSRVAKGFGRTVEEVTADTEQKLVDEYATKMKAGTKFPILELDYTDGFNQEGRHRALAAKQAGFTQVPVAVVTKPTAKKKLAPKKKGFVAVSPNDWDVEMSFDEAAVSIRSEKHQTSHAITDDILDSFGLEHTTSDALGDWADGAEDSLLVEVESPESVDQLNYIASLTGKFFNQKGALSFIVDENGVDSFYKIDIPIESGDINAIRSTLDELKLEFRTLVPTSTGTTVVIYDEGTTLSSSVAKFGKKHETNIEAYKGQGELIGSWDSRQDGISAYNRQIGAWERNNKIRYSPTREGLRDFWGTGYQEQGAETEVSSRTVAAPISLSRLNAEPIPDVYGKFGTLDAKKDTTENLKFYELDKLIANPKLVRDMVKSFGFEVKYFSFHIDEDAGVEFVIPKLKKQGYKDGYLWIYDPRVAHGSFKDTEYTRQWRIVHELGHAITEDFMQKRYGDSRREGRLGQSWMATRGHPDKKQVQVELDPLTLKEAQRAVEWEDVAFRVQRVLFESLGVTVDPVGFAHEYNTNVGDASYRVLTGDFGDPGEYGFVPRGTLPEVKSVLKMFENTENAMAREQGRKPTKGINLNTYKRIPLSDLKKAIKDAGDNLESLAKGKHKGSSAEYVEKVANIISKNWTNSPEIIVVATSEGLPAIVKEEQKERGVFGRASGVYRTSVGEVYLVADLLDGKEAIFSVVMHEIMGHHGVRGLFGTSLDGFLDEVYKANKEAIRDHAKSIGSPLDPKNRYRMTEEFLAVEAETNPQSTWVTRLISKVMQWARNIMPSLKLTKSEVIEVLVGMRQYSSGTEISQIAQNTVQQIQNNIDRVDGVYSDTAGPIKKFRKRFFTKEGGLPDEGFEAKIKADSLKKAGEEDVSFVVHRFEETMKKFFKAKSYISIPAADLETINNYLHGKDAKVPTELKEVLDGMRAYIDRLSAGMQKAMEDMMAIEYGKLTTEQQASFDAFLKGEPEGSIPAAIQSHYEMHKTISDNMGTYMNRSYEAFDNKKWKNKALKNKDLIKRAEAYIANLNPDFLPEEVHGAVRGILQSAQDSGNFFSFLSQGSKYGKKDVSMLTKRKDVPDIIRELLGEYTDPRVNFVRTSTNMYNYLANHEFLMQLRSKGLGVFLFERKIGGFDKQIAAKGSKSMNPIDGLYTTSDFILALEDTRDPIEGGKLMRGFIRLNSAIKYGKTILAPTTQARNFMSAAMFSVMNGHFNWSHGKKAFSAARSDLWTKDETWRKYLSNLITLGVLHDNPRAEELRHALEDFMKIDIYTKGSTQSLRRFLNFAQKLYQVGDDFWKIIGFENEVSLQMKTGKSRKEVEEKAAYRIRNGYPTYSMVPKAIRMLRRTPLIGTFVSFPYEIIRTSSNQVRFLAEDVMEGNKELAARRALGMAMATSISASLSYMSMLLMGLDKDDDEAVRKIDAPWVRNSQLIYLGYDENGYPKYYDFSYYDPYTYLKKPITALMNNNNEGLDKKIMDAMLEFGAPFFSPDIAAGAIGEVVFNKKLSTGGPVWNPQDNISKIAFDMTNHFRKAAQPGSFSNAESFIKAQQGYTSPGGKEYKTDDELFALVGFRMGTLNIPKAMSYKALDFNYAKRGASSILSKAVSSGSDVTKKEIKTAFNGMIRARESSFNEMIKMVKAAEKLQVKKSTIYRIILAGGISKKNAKYIMAGRVPRWRMSSSFMDSAQTRAIATAKKDKRHSIRKEFYERKKYVHELMSKQTTN